MSFLLELLKKIPLSKAGPAAGVLAGLIALVVIGYRMRWWQRLGHTSGPWLWVGLVLLVVVGLLVAILWLLPRYSEKRFLERIHSEDEQTPRADVKEGYRRLEEKMRQTLDKLRKSPELKGKGDPLYALPWYLLLGASQSGKTTLLQGVANQFLPFARPQSTAEGPAQECEWWFFNTAIVLDTPGSYAFPKEMEREGTQWYRFLRLLRHYRELQPINGLVITVAADSLTSKSEDHIRQEAAELRKRVHEAIQELGVDVPVYLLITRCDLIDGFTEFCSYLPEHTWRQVFGYVYEWPQTADGRQPKPTEIINFETVFASLVDRLQHLRLSMLNTENPLPVDLRQYFFCFPEEFRALQQSISTFIDTFLFSHPTLHMPYFRGLFFSSAQQQGIPASLLRRKLRFNGQTKALTQGAKTYFLHDLFKEILPRDQYLARPTGRTTRGRLFKHLFGLVGSVVLCLLLLVVLTKGFRDDRQAVRAAKPAICTAAAKAVGSEPLLEAAEECRQEVQALSERNHGRPFWGKLIFKRSVKLEERLRHDYVKKFSTEVLLPLDASLTHHLDADAETIPLVFLLIKRIIWLDQCVLGNGCFDPPPSKGQPDYQLASDNYRLMLDPARRRAPAPKRVGQLQRTYEAYLRWAPGVSRILNQEREAHAGRLQRWFSKNRFAPQQILQWANQSYPPVTLAEYWQAPHPDEGGDANPLPGAYTREAWRQSIAPFLQRALETVPEMGPQVEAFRKEYRQQYLNQWQRFLENFPRGEAFWKRTPEKRRELAVMFLSEKSPYHRIVDGAFENLRPVLSATPKVTTTLAAAATLEPVISDAKAELPPWLRLLQQYVGSKNRKAVLGILKQLGKQLTAEDMAEQSFRLASAGFQESKPPAESAHPVLKAWGIVGHFREQEGAGVDAKPFWPLLERPVQFIWEMVLYEAGKNLQERWTQKVTTPLKGLSELDQLNFLYGSQPKVRAFVDDVAKPFLTEDGKHVKKVLGLEAPLSPEFFKALEVAEQIGPILSSISTGQPVAVEAVGKSIIESQANLSEEKTEFQIECKSKAYKVLDQSQQLAETSATIFWSSDTCGDVVLTISFRVPEASSTAPEATILLLRKRYIGLAGFLRFIQDFSDGKHEFRPTDFSDPSNAGANWKSYGIKAIRVFYRVVVPPTLEKLIALMPNSDQMVTTTIIKGGGTI